MKQYIDDDDDEGGEMGKKEERERNTHTHTHKHTRQVFSLRYTISSHFILHHSSIYVAALLLRLKMISVTISTFFPVAVIEHDRDDTMLLLLLLLLHDAPFSSLCSVMMFDSVHVYSDQDDEERTKKERITMRPCLHRTRGA